MSVLAYAALTSRRLGSPKGKSTRSEPPGVRTAVDAMAALVPAEILTTHALVVGFATETKTSASGDVLTAITDVRGLEVAFYGLLVLTPLLYLGGRRASNRAIESLDLVRALVPAAAFVVWTMLQRSTAFDAVASDLPASTRSILAVLAAPVLGLGAGFLGVKADQKDP